MTFVEYAIIFLLSGTGFFFISAFTAKERPFRALAGAFPLGCCLWAASTFVIAILPIIPKNIFRLNVSATLVLMSIITIYSLVVTWKRDGFRPHNTVLFLIAFSFIAFLYWFFLQVNFSIITPDSLYQLHPHAGFDAMNSGRSFNQTLAALASLAGQDRYFFPFHSLFAVSLTAIIAECIFHEVKSATVGIGPALSSALVGILLFTSCHMTAIQIFYVNNHMLMSFMITFSLSVLLGCNDKQPASSLPLALLGVISVSFLCSLRLEGQLVAIILLVIMLGRPEVDRSARIRSFFLFAILTSPFMLYMIDLLSAGGMVDSRQFAAMYLTTLLLPVFFTIQKPAWIVHFQRKAHIYTLFGMAVLITTVASFHLGRILERLGHFWKNTFIAGNWGFSNLIIVLAIISFLGMRFFLADPSMTSRYRRTDNLLFFYLASLLSILFLMNFHGSHPGWSDSQNRMLFHFFPAIIIWICIQTGFGFTEEKQGDMTVQINETETRI